MLFIINLCLIFVSGWIAIKEFKRGNARGGWFNVFASAINLAAVLFHLSNL